MSLLGRILGHGGLRRIDGRPLTDPILGDWMGTAAGATASGIAVTPESALRVSAVYACVTLIAETIGSLPMKLLREDGRFRRPASGHPLERTLTQQPNPEMEAGEFWEQMVGWKLVRGNALAWIDRRGEETFLWPIPWNRVRVLRTPSRRELLYVVRLSGAESPAGLDPDTDIPLLAGEVIHVRNFGLGPVGMSPIQQAAEAIGLSLAAEEYGARFFANSAQPGGYLRVPNNLTDAEFDRMLTRWRQLHQGVKRAHMIGLLEGGIDWVKVGITPEEAQFLELRRYQVADIARMFRVPPHMIGDVERSTSWGTGIEQQGIGFVIYTLGTHLGRVERVVRSSLLWNDPELFFRFVVNGLLRGDQAARYAAYATGRQWGWLSVNDIRALEDMEPIPGGDVYLSPTNMVPVAHNGHQPVATNLDVTEPSGSFVDEH